MSDNQNFNVAVMVYTDFYSYINEVINEIGSARALALLTKVYEAKGTAMGKSIKQESGGKEFDAHSAGCEIIDLAKEIGGIDEIMLDTPTKFETKTDCGKCPNYAAAKAANLDNDTIKAICGAGSLRLFDTLVKQLNPNLSYQLKKFRSNPNDYCLEATVLSKAKK